MIHNLSVHEAVSIKVEDKWIPNDRGGFMMKNIIISDCRDAKTVITVYSKNNLRIPVEKG